MTIEEIQKSTEFQVFDRRKDSHRCGQDDGTLTGVDRMLTLSTSVATRHISSKLGSVLAAPSVP